MNAYRALAPGHTREWREAKRRQRAATRERQRHARKASTKNDEIEKAGQLWEAERLRWDIREQDQRGIERWFWQKLEEIESKTGCGASGALPPAAAQIDNTDDETALISIRSRTILDGSSQRADSEQCCDGHWSTLLSLIRDPHAGWHFIKFPVVFRHESPTAFRHGSPTASARNAG